jgi:hypothetical protein
VNLPPFWFVFSVKTVGIFGEAYSVGGGIFTNAGEEVSSFLFTCDRDLSEPGAEPDRYILEGFPKDAVTHTSPAGVRAAFSERLSEAMRTHWSPLVAARFCHPGPSRFLSQSEPRPQNPTILHDIASIMLAAGMDPVATYPRLASELPKHNPLADARQSARLLGEAIRKLQSR